MQQRYSFVVVGSIVMPEHIHLLIGKPELGDPLSAVRAGTSRHSYGKLPKTSRPMTPVEFKILFSAPFGFTPDLPKAAVITTRPKWRILDFAFQRGPENAYEMLVRIHPADLKAKSASLCELRTFHDTVLAMLAMTAIVPVIPLHQGMFTFRCQTVRSRRCPSGSEKPLRRWYRFRRLRRSRLGPLYPTLFRPLRISFGKL